MGKHKYIHGRGGEEEVSYWLSYSDMMAALLLVFVLITSFSMMVYKKNLEEQQNLLNAQQKKIDEMIGIRNDLITALSKEFAGTSLNVTVDSKTGAIVFDSNLLFKRADHKLSKDGEKFLDKFLPQYFGVLLSDKYKGYVAEIIIEGHTDPDGSYLYNLELSQSRALAVAAYCLSYNKKLPKGMVDELRKLVTANGRSESDLIYKSDGQVDKAASRRVEIKFRLKDEEMIRDMANILNEK